MSKELAKVDTYNQDELQKLTALTFLGTKKESEKIISFLNFLLGVQG